MVNKSEKEEKFNQDDVEITNEEIDTNEPDLEEIEEKEKGVISSLREKLKTCEANKREILEEVQIVKADFLNARKRLEEEKNRDRERSTMKFVEQLLPLCDSFEMAMNDKETWDKADENWRKGVEGIYAQLKSILTAYSVKTVSPIGELFDPRKHEALSMAPVTDGAEHDKVVNVIQMGYELVKNDGETEQIRPARVVIGVYDDK